MAMYQLKVYFMISHFRKQDYLLIIKDSPVEAQRKSCKSDD